MKQRNFKEDFQYLLGKLKDGENFAFTRFSDGEMDVLQNLRLELTHGKITVGNKVWSKGYQTVDHKSFDPDIPEHQVFRKSLDEAFKFRKKNYFKGLSCQCCVGPKDAQWMIDQHGSGDDEHLTWANLLLNGNYADFIEKMVPVFDNKKCVMICHHDAKLKKIPFSLVKEFRVGYNAFINDINVIHDMGNWIKKEDIKDHIFLFSASSFSSLATHKLFEMSSQNTYINIGTTLNPRDLSKVPSEETLNKTCIWI